MNVVQKAICFLGRLIYQLRKGFLPFRHPTFIMINAGAIALCTLINGDTYKEKFSRLLNLIRKIAGNPHLTVDEDVYISEKSTGSKNRALAYMLKAYGMISDNLTKSYEECRMLSKYESLPTEEKADYEANSEEYNKRRMNNLSVCFKEV